MPEEFHVRSSLYSVDQLRRGIFAHGLTDRLTSIQFTQEFWTSNQEDSDKKTYKGPYWGFFFHPYSDKYLIVKHVISPMSSAKLDCSPVGHLRFELTISIQIDEHFSQYCAILELLVHVHIHFCTPLSDVLKQDIDPAIIASVIAEFI